MTNTTVQETEGLQLVEQIARNSFLALSVAGSVTYLAIKCYGAGSHLSDFKYFWVAGTMWRHGLSPFDLGAFATIGKSRFPDFQPLWMYPPHWYIIASIMSIAPPTLGVFIWRALNCLMAALSAQILASACHVGRIGRISVVFGFMVWFTCTSQSTIMSLIYAQTSVLMLFGCAMFVRGTIRNSIPYLVAGLLILSLKPNIGAVFLITSIFLRRGIVVLLWTGFIGGLAAVPALIIGGVGGTLKGFTESISLYGEYPINQPGMMYGVGHFLAQYTERIDISLVLPLFAVLLCLTLGALTTKLPDIEVRELLIMNVGIAAASSILMLHIYDLTISIPLLLTRRAYSLRFAVPAAALPLLAWRGMNDFGLVSFGAVISLAAVVLGSISSVYAQACSARTSNPAST